MERRVLLALLLSFLVLFAYQAFFVRPVPKTAPAGASAGAPGGAPAESPTATPQPTAKGSTPLVAEALPPAGVTALTGESEEREIRVETPRIVAVFTNRGARLKSWRLKQYHDSGGNPLELIDTDLGGELPFSLRTDDDATTSLLNGGFYAVTTTPSAGIQTSPVTIAFEYRDSSGLSATKEFVLDPSTYTIQFRTSVIRGDNPVVPAVIWGPGPSDDDTQSGRYAVKPGGVYSVGGKVTRLSAKDVGSQPSYEQNFEYAGIEDHYFTIFAYKIGQAKLTYQNLSIPAPAGSKAGSRDLMGYAIQAPARPDAMMFYAGPKDFDVLAAIDRNFTKTINFGMFAVLIVPLLRTLNWINAYLGNYGWSIVALTVLINLLLFPFNHWSVVSMRKMQEIQPEAKVIQDRYAKLKATDPAKQKMNQELMALYRERGVNPATGCLPMLLILPVFLAFYSMLSTAIELRGAPFVGWIHDLSQPDAWYVLPILVGLSQFATQLMTPAAGVDPTQQKMMLFMPLVMIFVFVGSPAGALIYWFVGAIWRIGQQSLTNKLIGPPKVRGSRPPAERRVKRVGSGKTQDAARET
jgi:YidC/Oxa1 family membrane protein insertase